MSRRLKIAAIQIPNWVEGSTAKEKYQSNLRNIEKYLRMAGETGCDLTGVGECSNTRKLSQEEKQEVLPDLLGGPEIEIGTRLAKEFGMNVVLGIAGRHEGKKRNAGVVIDRGGRIEGIHCQCSGLGHRRRGFGHHRWPVADQCCQKAHCVKVHRFPPYLPLGMCPMCPMCPIT